MKTPQGWKVDIGGLMAIGIKLLNPNILLILNLLDGFFGMLLPTEKEDPPAS